MTDTSTASINDHPALAQAKGLRQVVLDTETTGLDSRADRIIEIGCVELYNRRLTANNFHQYINPMQEIGQGAIDVHGITNEFLADKSLFSDVVHPFLDYVRGAELVIHNASFDVGFINAELHNYDPALGKIEDYCTIIDSLALARELHPGQRNDLDTLARRYTVDNSQRTLHGALLDSEILADVYLLMSGGQHALELENSPQRGADGQKVDLDLSAFELPVFKADMVEIEAHNKMLGNMEREGVSSIWNKVFN